MSSASTVPCPEDPDTPTRGKGKRIPSGLEHARDDKNGRHDVPGKAANPGSTSWDFDYIVIGSGFGGSVSALRLVEKGYRVAVMEMGRRWTPENLPRTSWSFHRWFWRPGLAMRGFFNMRFFRHVTILHGCAVGGGSITYACTLLRPPEKVWDSGDWVGLADWKTGDAAALRHGVAHAGRHGEQDSWPG